MSSITSKHSYTLTKSTFLRGMQCPKSLMLDALHPELRDPLDSHAQLRMRLGQEVGMLARERYPGGDIGRFPGQIEPSLQRTQELMGLGVNILYEPAFQHAGVFILVDVLVKGQNGWRLMEVKSTSQFKDEHLWDIAVQTFVLRGAGIPLEEAVLLHINSEYVRRDELDLQVLLKEEPLLVFVDELRAQVEDTIESSIAHLEARVVPERDIGPYCREPVDCDFIGHCWSHLPSPSVFDVYRMPSKKKFALYQSGIDHIDQIPESFSMPSSSHFHVEAHKARSVVLKREELKSFIESLQYPLHFLDFETFNVPIPPFEGLKPYVHVPFQYSLHKQLEPDSELTHSGFLAEAGSDPRLEFIEKLLKETEDQGDIIVYNANFERGVLMGLVEQFPMYTNELERRIERLVDLMVPFRDRFYWTPAMGGSVSLKSVLPALVPELSYDTLEVQDGTQAMGVYLGLEDLGDSSAAEAQRDALWEYCKLDTLAMVRVMEVLHSIVS